MDCSMTATEKLKNRRMVFFLHFLSAVSCLGILLLCGCSNQNMDHAVLDSKAVEPGEEPSENIADYLETEDAGTVADTTPPQIIVKDICPEPTEKYLLSDIVEITDKSDWEIVEPGYLDSLDDIVIVSSGDNTIELEVCDEFGNTAKQNIVLQIRSRGEDIPKSRTFETFVQMEFGMNNSYELMTKDNFEILTKAYNDLNRNFKVVEGKLNEKAQQAFLEMLYDERPVYDVWVLADGRKIYKDATLFSEKTHKETWNLESMEFRFFDVDDDGENELVIQGAPYNYVFDYHAKQNLISEYEYVGSSDLFGTGVMYYVSDNDQVCINIRDDGEIVKEVVFQSVAIADDLTMYTAIMPDKYSFTEEEMNSLKEQAYYIQEGNFLCFNLTKEQFEELEAMFPPMTEQEKEALAGVTYTYDELITFLDEKNTISDNEKVNQTVKQLTGETGFVPTSFAKVSIKQEEYYVYVGAAMSYGSAYLIDQDGDVIYDFGNEIAGGNWVDTVSQKENGDIALHECMEEGSIFKGVTFFYRELDGTYELKYCEPDYEFSWFEGMEKCPKKYRDYMGKYWAAGQKMPEQETPIEFYFTKITNQYVEGRILYNDRNGLVLTSASTTPEYTVTDWGFFSGTVQNGEFVCSEYYADGEKGNELSFRMNGHDSMEVQYGEEKTIYKPFKIADMKDYIIDEKLSTAIDEGLWKGCTIVTGQQAKKNKLTAQTYIVDQDSNVLYGLSWNQFQEGEKVTGIGLTDSNKDGRMDIVIDYESGRKDLFQQKDGGAFYQI